ncbi:MAG: hypothetical protein ACRDTF_16060 [Pseudonocardiaceae bacterium]
MRNPSGFAIRKIPGPSALSSLYTAREHAPQRVRYHPSVHEALAVLAETDRRHCDSLAGFAHWAGVTYLQER